MATKATVLQNNVWTKVLDGTIAGIGIAVGGIIYVADGATAPAVNSPSIPFNPGEKFNFDKQTYWMRSDNASVVTMGS